ncbi:MAG: AbrB family transcriptional regulator [Angelakisella sp.]
MWWQLILTLSVACFAGYILFRLKLPGGMMVGAIVGVAMLSIFTGNAYMPSSAKVAAQIAAGAFIGCSVEKSDIVRLRHILRPALILLGGMLGLNIIAGFIIYAVSPLDLLTAMMCAVPGGMSDIPLIAADMGADAAKVTVLQFVRMVMGIGFFPTLIGAFDRRFGSGQRYEAVAPVRVESTSQSKNVDFAFTLAAATLGGLFGKAIGMPAGILVFSMVVVICLKLACNRVYLPMWVKRAAQLLSGAYVGSGFTKGDLLELRYLVVPAIVVIIAYSINCILTGQLLHRACGMELKESMLAATPAGASDMALISSDLGVQSSDLVVLHVIRLVVVVAVFPQVIHIIVNCF